jgi:hypothetical protein
MNALPGLQINQAKPLMRRECCGKCKFHSALPGQPHFECRFNPPVPHIAQSNHGMQTVCVFPIVMAEHWCGQFKMHLDGIN